MKKEYEASILIRAPREKIWSILTDGPSYPKWNDTIDKLEGQVAPGHDLKIWAKVAPGRAFPAKVTEFEPPGRMVWSFSGPLGMFKGSRSFTLTEKDGAVEFHTREVFGGWMAWMIVRTMPDLQPSFDSFAACLKKAAES